MSETLPDNVNLLSPLNFIFTIKKTPNINYHCQSVNIPGISMGNAEQPNPYVNVPVAGDHIIFGDLNIDFKVDEDLSNYLEIFNWMKGIGFPDSNEQYADLNSQYRGLGVLSDATCLILNSAKNPNVRVDYVDIFPISLSDIYLDSREVDVNVAIASATFKISSFNITKL